MFQDNLKTLRKNKGYTQEELASRLKVVRQTVSKWEKGLSVPDAEMLLKIADEFEVSVSELLGAKIEDEESQNDVAIQLAKINEQLVIKNRRARKVWIGVLVFVVIIPIVLQIFILISSFLYSANMVGPYHKATEEWHTEIEEWDTELEYTKE